MIKRREQGLVEQFVTQASIEALVEAILHGLPRRDIMPFDTLLLRPTEDRVAGELGPVVADYHFRLASVRDDPMKLPNDPIARQRRVSDEAYAFPSAYIDHSQNPEPAPVGQLVRHKVERPAFVGNQQLLHARPSLQPHGIGTDRVCRALQSLSCTVTRERYSGPSS